MLQDDLKPLYAVFLFGLVVATSLLAAVKRESEETLSKLVGSVYFTVFALIPTLTFLAVTSKQLGLTDLP